MRPFALASLLTLATGLPAAAAPIAWICTLSDDLVRLVCIADVDPHDAGAPRAPASARVNGTTFPLDAGRIYHVDLWSPPTEADFVEQLARATICYRSPGCSVTMAGTSWHALARLPAPGPRTASAR